MAAGSLFRSYNLLLEKAAADRRPRGAGAGPSGRRDRRSRLLQEVAWRASSDPEVGVVGCVGAIGVRNIAWWEGSVTWASFVTPLRRARRWRGPGVLLERERALPPYARLGEVDTVDGFVLVLSPWVVQQHPLRRVLGQLHGYDLDFCLQVAARGQEGGDGRLQGDPPSLVGPRQRPRAPGSRRTCAWPTSGTARCPASAPPRAPGRKSASPGRGGGRRRPNPDHVRATSVEARAKQLEEAIDEMTGSMGWKATEPLRRLNARRKAAGGRREPSDA